MIIYIVSIVLFLLNYSLQYDIVKEYLCRLFYLVIFIEIYIWFMSIWINALFIPSFIDIIVCMGVISMLNKEIVLEYEKTISYTHHTTIYFLCNLIYYNI